ncbi:hypothetical protein [Qipengyuania sp. ASV99]|uniref:hypothetical protein n=1 Tax=Qipengyuania sp. ASV99 TaxID=3399681 RepID=UPI003A4C73BB
MLACAASNDRPDLGIEPYPQWPPEQPSWTTQIDYLIESREGLSLYDAATRLRDALRAADYSAHSFYSVPGGFVLVTVTEQIDTEGYSMPGRFRYGAPGEGREDLLTRIRDLFLVRPESYYRYVAIVVSNRSFRPGESRLNAQEANRRVVQGSTDLSRDARDIRFTDDFKVNALIYEYENPGIGIDLIPVEPRMLDARLHLERMGLVGTIQRAFGPESN